MGYAFTFHVVSTLCQIPIGAYIHYPTISTNMLARVKTRTRWHTNTEAVSQSAVLSWGKLLYFKLHSRSHLILTQFTRYYRIFMYYYAVSIRRASFIMVNSSWTKGHIDAILQHSDPLLNTIHLLPPLNLLHLFARSQGLTTAQTVYPSCDTKEMASLELRDRECVILSIAQFRLVFHVVFFRSLSRLNN
jgi:alpha-1,2-mannosyltransferase